MHPVVKTVLERLGLGLVTLFMVSIIIFSAIEMLPGDFGQAILGQSATPETVAAFRRQLGLDQPPYIRYLQWVAGAIQGDLGTSFYTEAGNFLNTGIAYKIIKSSTGIGTWGVTGLVVQVVDNVNDLNSYSRPSIRGKLAVKPLKKVQIADSDFGKIGEDVAATASNELIDITSEKQFFYPNDSRHRYAYLLNVTAPVTHSA